MGSLDNPEVLLTMEGMVVRETWCSKRLPEETETGLGVIGDSRGGSELAKGKDKGKGKIDSRNVGSVVRYRYGSRDGEIL